MRQLFLLALCLWAPLASADLWIGPGALSYHTDRGTPHNEVNAGANVEYAWTAHDAVGLGLYRNSNWRESRYAVYRWTPWNAGNVRLGAIVGVVDGYAFNNGGIGPAAGLVAVYDRKQWGLNLIATPYVGGAVFALQFKWRLF